MKHCTNLKDDREVGQFWEREFSKMAAQQGYMFTPMQIGRSSSIVAYKGTAYKKPLTLPDVTIWTCPGQHHEIKHKNPTRFDSFGLEAYRFYALLGFAQETQQDVMYTIHNHDLAGGRDVRENDMAHWLTVDVCELQDAWVFEKTLPSWVDGTRQTVKQYFWPAGLWMPLARYWGVEGTCPTPHNVVQ